MNNYALQSPAPLASAKVAVDEQLVDFLAEAEDSLLDAWLVGTESPDQAADPLCIVAFGGTGRKIAAEMKAGFIERMGHVPAYVRILTFDSADDPVTAMESRNGRVVRLEPGSEDHKLPRVPVEGIRRNLPRHPEIEERLGPMLATIRRTSIHNGAAQQRTQGLLATAWGMPVVWRQIETALRQLTGRSDDLAEQLQRKQGVTVLLIASAPGGQGSGALFDGAYAVRDILHQLGDQADVSRVLGLIVLPAAFVGLRGGNLQANTYALLTELEHLMTQARFQARYPGGLRVNSHETPFDQVFLLDGIDELGRAWPNHDEVCANGARAMIHLLASSVGREEAAKALNSQEAGDLVSRGGLGTYLSTVGLAVIRFPARMVAQRCALRQARSLIQNHLLVGMTDAQIALLPGFAGAGGLQEQLLRDTSDAPYRMEIGIPPSVEQGVPEEVPYQFRTLYAHFLERRLYGDVFTKMESKRAALEAGLLEQLGDQFQILQRQSQLLLLDGWLERTQAELQQTLAHFTTENSRMAQECADQQTAVERAQGSLEEAAVSFPPLAYFRRRAVRPALAACVDEANRAVLLLTEERSTDLACAICRRLLVWLDSQRRSVDGTVERLHQADQRLAGRETTLAHLDGSYNEISVADDELVDELYQEYAVRADLLVQQAVEQSDGLFSWRSQRPEQVAALLASVSTRPFQPIRTVTVEDILARRWDDRSAQQWIERLEHLAAGAWNLDSALLPGGGAGLARFLVLGVPDARRSIFSEAGRPLVSSHDPERIVALRTIYGASIDALKAMPIWKTAYEAAIGRVPLHVLPEFMRQDDTSVQFFALAIVFDYVTTRGPWFYLRTGDPLEPELKLGQGLEKALAAFGDEPELRLQVDERVAEEIRKQGVAWALELLDRYISAGSQKDDPLTQKLRRAARDYADELRRSSQAIASLERGHKQERAAQ